MAIRIEHRIGVSASADTIWALISDLNGWSAWNPLYPEATGKLSIGGTLKITEAVPGKPPRTIAPVVVDWEPGAQILWRHDAGFMSRTVRYLEIESLSETGCIFANGAFFHGMLGERAAKGGPPRHPAGLRLAGRGGQAGGGAALARPGERPGRRRMIDDLYSDRILRPGGQHAARRAPGAPHGTAEKTAKLCGSRIVVDLTLADGRVTDFAQEVKACALGQAAAAVLGANVVGATVEEVAAARDDLRAMLKTGGPARPAASPISRCCAVREFPLATRRPCWRWRRRWRRSRRAIDARRPRWPSRRFVALAIIVHCNVSGWRTPAPMLGGGDVSQRRRPSMSA
jgi:NifU-like protein involved in Fe-S cluster formation